MPRFTLIGRFVHTRQRAAPFQAPPATVTNPPFWVIYLRYRRNRVHRYGRIYRWDESKSCVWDSHSLDSRGGKRRCRGRDGGSIWERKKRRGVRFMFYRDNCNTRAGCTWSHVALASQERSFIDQWTINDNCRNSPGLSITKQTIAGKFIIQTIKLNR